MMRNLKQNKFFNDFGEFGRKLFSSLVSRLGFLRRGKMTALLKTWGNEPELRDELISAVSDGRRQSSISSRSGVGMGSREQVLGADFMITCLLVFNPCYARATLVRARF